MSIPEGKDNKNPDNRYLPYCQKYHTCGSWAFCVVEGRYFLVNLPAEH